MNRKAGNMTNFKKIFTNTPIYPQSIEYKGRIVVLSDRFQVNKKENLIINIEHTKSPLLQGIRLRIEGRCYVNGEAFNQGKLINLLLWEESNWYDLKNHQEVEIHSNSPNIHISNAWMIVQNGEDGPPCWAGGDQWMRNDEMGGAGMIVEEIENGKQYYCNDGDCDDDFDDIIFTVTRKKN